MKNSIKVTTTPGFDGIRINEYLQPITAHVVVGMNVFKDFIASITDVIGGTSGTYVETLEEINQRAISDLKIKAADLGANCIIGLKIDNNEISAKGKSMLMVTAVGTAAIADFSNNPKPEKKETKEKLLDASNEEEILIEKYNLNNEDVILMRKYNIKYSNEMFYFENYKYQNLVDAIKYAEVLEKKKK